MRIVVFLTYNQVADFGPGWHEHQGRRAFVASNVRNRKWAATQYPASLGDYAISRLRIMDEIEAVWTSVEPIIDLVDHAVVYIGSECSDYFILKASKLPAGKVTYVTCPCKAAVKDQAMGIVGHGKARRVQSACGGHDMMKNMIANFLYTGKLSCDHVRLAHPPAGVASVRINAHLV